VVHAIFGEELDHPIEIGIRPGLAEVTDELFVVV
jgi:hypothetical protein